MTARRSAAICARVEPRCGVASLPNPFEGELEKKLEEKLKWQPLAARCGVQTKVHEYNNRRLQGGAEGVVPRSHAQARA